MKFRALASAAIVSLLLGCQDHPQIPHQFAADASQASEFGLAMSRAALLKAERRDVRYFAEQIDDKQQQAALDLVAAAGATGKAPVSATLDQRRSLKLAELDRLTGSEFDRLYIELQLAAHEEAVGLFREFTRRADDGALRRFAKNRLATLEAQLSHVRGLHATPSI